VYGGDTPVAGDGTADQHEGAADVDTSNVEAVAAVGGAGDLRAMMVEVGAAGEELPPAVTPTSAGDSGQFLICSVDFKRSP